MPSSINIIIIGAISSNTPKTKTSINSSQKGEKNFLFQISAHKSTEHRQNRRYNCAIMSPDMSTKGGKRLETNGKSFHRRNKFQKHTQIDSIQIARDVEVIYELNYCLSYPVQFAHTKGFQLSTCALVREGGKSFSCGIKTF